MSKADEPLALAERCENAREGSRELDGDIAAAIRLYPHDWRRGSKDASAYAIWFDDEHRTSWRAPDFTTSLDAAMTLVPEGFMRAIGSHNENNQPWACLTEPDGACRDYAATGADEVLALCAAALRAAAEMDS